MKTNKQLILALAVLAVLASWDVNAQMSFTNFGLTSDRDLIDQNADNLGDTNGNLANATLQVGEQLAGGATSEFRGLLVFDISGMTSQIYGATNITLNVRLDTRTGAPIPFNVDVVGLNGFRTSTNAVVTDFEAASTLLAPNFVTNNQPLGYYKVDVRTFAQIEQVGGASVLMFRLQSSDPSIPDSDGTLRRFSFNSADATSAAERPFLTVMIPEPSGLMMALLSGVLMLFLRRSRS